MWIHGPTLAVLVAALITIWAPSAQAVTPVTNSMLVNACDDFAANTIEVLTTRTSEEGSVPPRAEDSLTLMMMAPLAIITSSPNEEVSQCSIAEQCEAVAQRSSV